MKLAEFTNTNRALPGLEKLNPTQNETLLEILNFLMGGDKKCIILIKDVLNDNEVTIEPKKECNLNTLKSDYEKRYSNVGLEFSESGGFIKLKVNPQPPTKKSTDDTTTTSDNSSNDFNIYRQVAKTFMGEELNEEINRIKKIIYNG